MRGDAEEESFHVPASIGSLLEVAPNFDAHEWSSASSEETASMVKIVGIMWEEGPTKRLPCSLPHANVTSVRVMKLSLKLSKFSHLCSTVPF